MPILCALDRPGLPAPWHRRSQADAPAHRPARSAPLRAAGAGADLDQLGADPADSASPSACPRQGLPAPWRHRSQADAPSAPAGTIGAPALQQAAKALETALRERDAALETLFTGFADELRQVTDGIARGFDIERSRPG